MIELYCCYPWIVPHQRQQQDLADFPNLQRWFVTVRERPATRRAYQISEEIDVAPVVSEEAKRTLFGQDASIVKAATKKIFSGTPPECGFT